MSRHTMRTLTIVTTLSTLSAVTPAWALPPRGRVMAMPFHPMPFRPTPAMAAPMRSAALERMPIIPHVPAPALPRPPAGHEQFPTINRNVTPTIPVVITAPAPAAQVRHLPPRVPHPIQMLPGFARSGYMAAYRSNSMPVFPPANSPFIAAFSAFPPQFFAAQALPLTPAGVAAMNAAATNAVLSAAALGIPLLPSSLSSFNFLSTGLGTALTASSPFGFSRGFTPNPLLTGLSNPFSLAASPFNSAPYAGMGGYGGGGGGGYGGGSYAVSMSGQQNAPSYPAQMRAEEKPAESANVLTAFGLPNKEGRLVWPLGLRVLAPAPATNRMREQIDTLAAVILGQKNAYGQVDSSLVQELDRAVNDLRQQITARPTDMSQVTYNDSVLFLQKLQDAVKAMR